MFWLKQNSIFDDFQLLIFNIFDAFDVHHGPDEIRLGNLGTGLG